MRKVISIIISLFFVYMAVVLGSCSPVKFSAGSDQVTAKVTPVDCSSSPDPTKCSNPGTISCNPLLNSGQTSVTVTVSGTNPTLSANCTPNTVSYDWQVTRNGTPVTVPGLSGAVSTPNFTSLGVGSYEIRLTSSTTGYNSYISSQPLTVTVTPDNNNPMTQIQCVPKLNGSQTAVTLSDSNQSVQVSANCTPPDVSYSWTATRDNVSVVVPGLAGSTSTPGIYGLGAGIYRIYLTASKNGYITYSSASPLTVTVPSVTLRKVTYSKTVNYEDNQLDILLVLDDSNSMLADNRRLAARLQSFVNDLGNAGFDWQMCLTVVHAQRVSSTDSNLYWGASNDWVGNNGSRPWIMNSSTANPYNVFYNTVNQIGAGNAGSDDERAIKAAYWHMDNGHPFAPGGSGCYRENAGLSVLILSDEDERSVGGDMTQQFYSGEYQPLEADDMPQTYQNYVRSLFGNDKRFTVNSIIVRPGDSACLAQQDAEGSKAHYGVKYNELSQLTSGYVGSICDNDYSTNLSYFKDKIINSLSSIPLECTPVGSVSVNVSPSMGGINTYIENQKLIFNPKIPVGRTVTIEYNCAN